MHRDSYRRNKLENGLGAVENELSELSRQPSLIEYIELIKWLLRIPININTIYANQIAITGDMMSRSVFNAAKVITQVAVTIN